VAGTGVIAATGMAGPVLARQAFGRALWLIGGGEFRAACPPGWPLPGGQADVRVFSGQAGQVRVVRAFVRDRLAVHPARDEAVLVASELAANSAGHSLSGGESGRFAVQVVMLGAGHAGVVVTDRGGPPVPPVPAVPDVNAESGRGLTVVRSLSCWFRIHDHDGGFRSFAAIVPGTCGTGRPACRPADWIELGW
jgi:anti-sigma regulatory factor (Ser/Thr protein kinase)